MSTTTPQITARIEKTTDNIIKVFISENDTYYFRDIEEMENLRDAIDSYLQKKEA